MRRIAAFRFADNCPASRLTIQKLKHFRPRALSKRDQRRRAAMRGDACTVTHGGHRMRKSLPKSLLMSFLAAAALGAVFLLGAPADKAAAMMSATPNQIGLPNSDDNLVQKAALVCGRLGCRRVWAGRRAWWGPRRVAWWHRRAWWGPHRVAWWHRRIWWGPRRVAWGARRYWRGANQVAWRPRPLFAYAGASPALGPAWGWSNPGWSVAAWSGPGWGWGWSGPGWGGGWGSGLGWRRPWWNSW